MAGASWRAFPKTKLTLSSALVITIRGFESRYVHQLKQYLTMKTKQRILTIDGSQGEGGGQILRTSLSLSMCLGQAIKITNIRAGRGKPGLLRQHLTCVRAAKEICNAQVIGDELASPMIEFNPGKISGGDYKFAIGTAGSTSLVFQTVFPALLKANAQSTVSFEGGTHNIHAPSYEFITQCFLIALKKMNLSVECELIRYGFYPNGGGKWEAKIHAVEKNKALMLLNRGELLSKKAIVFISKIPLHVSQRELKKVATKLKWNADELINTSVDSPGPGNLISLQMVFENTVELIEEVAQRGLTAEKVAGNAINRLLRYQQSNAVVGEHLADQLLLPMALNAGGSFISHSISEHVKTNINVINQFIDNAISVEKIDDDTVKIIVKGLTP